MHWGYDFWGMHWVWWIIWISFLIWIFFTPWSIPGERKSASAEDPVDILKKRFAKGEITREEFEQAIQVLQGPDMK